MKQILIPLVMLAGVTHAFLPAAETRCNAIHNTSLCSITVGGSVFIQVVTNASGHQLRCRKQLRTGSMKVFSLKREKVKIEEAFENRAEFFINNGTLKITNVEKNDSGQYNVDVFDSEASFLKNIYINLDVKENIWPLLIIGCSVAGALVIVVMISGCVCCRVRHRKKSSCINN